jgi:hypothetical protein
LGSEFYATNSATGQGVGRALSQETVALALGAGLENLSVQITVDRRQRLALLRYRRARAQM